MNRASLVHSSDTSASRTLHLTVEDLCALGGTVTNHGDSYIAHLHSSSTAASRNLLVNRIDGEVHDRVILTFSGSTGAETRVWIRVSEFGGSAVFSIENVSANSYVTTNTSINT